VLGFGLMVGYGFGWGFRHNLHLLHRVFRFLCLGNPFDGLLLLSMVGLIGRCIEDIVRFRKNRQLEEKWGHRNGLLDLGEIFSGDIIQLTLLRSGHVAAFDLHIGNKSKRGIGEGNTRKRGSMRIKVCGRTRHDKNEEDVRVTMRDMSASERC